ncbi:MAG: ZIP family metal transporter [Candidatus Amoebophilus sp.]
MFAQIISLFLASLLGGFVVLMLPKLKPSTFNFLLVFVGSYLFSLTILHLLPDLLAFQTSSHFIGFYVLVGFFLQLLLGMFSKGVEHGHMYESTHQEYHGISATALFISLCVHAFLDGVILSNATLAVCSHSHVSTNTRLLVGIVLHKSSEAFALVSVLQGIVHKRRAIFVYLFGFSFASPLGLWISKYCSQSLLFNQKVFVALAAVAVGNLLHISTTIFFESSPHHRINFRRLIAIVAGIGVVMILEYLL